MLQETSALATLGWVARARGIASKGFHDGAANWLAANRAPDRAIRVFQKAAIGAGSSVDSDLGDYGVSAFSASARTRSAFYRILDDNGFTRVPLNTRVGITTIPATGTAVGEGATVPVSRVTLQNVLVEPVLASALIVVSDTLLRDVSAAGQALFNNELKGAVSDAVDAAFLDLIVNTGTTSTVSAGATAVNAKHDLRTALLAVNTVGAARLYWVAAPDVAAKASTLADTAGGDAFAAMSASGGELANLPCIVSSGVSSGELYLIDASGIAADGGPVTVVASSQADILMDTAPAMNGTTPTPAAMVSMFETNSTALKCDARFGASVLRDDCVAVVTGINWGDLMTEHSESAAVSLTNGHSTPRPAQMATARQRPIGRAEIEKLAHLIAVELGQALRRLDKLEAACGLSKSTPQPGVEAIAPVIRNYIESRLRPVEALVHELDGDAMRFADVYKSGKTYKRGQVATYKGGVWLALGATDTKPGTGDWKLVVKSGAFGPRDDETRKSADDET